MQSYGSAYVSCDKQRASEIGLAILQQGGNAADAAIAMAAAVGFLQPEVCGLGGDCNCIFYRASDSSVLSINGSGRSSARLTLEMVKAAGVTTEADKKNMQHHGLMITVPGAVAGMFNCIKHFGSGNVTIKDILDPAIKLAEEGAEVSSNVAMSLERRFPVIENSENRADIMGKDYPPATGSKIFAPKLAKCMKNLVEKGMEEFYMGDTASRIVSSVQKAGGVLTLEDMKHHYDSVRESPVKTPLSTEFHGYKIWEMAPNTTGIVVLVAMKILEGFDLKVLGHNSAEYIHLVVEAVNYAFSVCWPYLCDPDSSSSYNHLLTPEYAAEARKSINLEKHSDLLSKFPDLFSSGDTSYVTAVDTSGNACSFIFSICSGFGSGNIPDHCGFVLHNRGRFFSLNEASPNVFGPRKQCLHTIIPSIVTDAITGELMASLGVVGLWMQPQGHIQVLLNMIIFGMDPQTALDKPRFCYGDSSKTLNFLENDTLYIEDDVLPSVSTSLAAKGHNVQLPPRFNSFMFGKGHVIAKQKFWMKDPQSESTNLWLGAADTRWDGIALAFK